jgi:DNA repair protein SbcC/Rad50
VKILAIRGENLASLYGRFEVRLDAAPIAGAGLFAIAGPTGAGKSTLLDALCLALFGKTPRLSDHGGVAIGRADEDEKLRVSANDARALLSRGQSSGWAEVDFTGVDGRTYRAKWTVRRAKGQAGGKLQPQELTLRELEAPRQARGERHSAGAEAYEALAVVSEKLAETREAIVKRLGFSFDEFRRAVVLPQFEFTNFLKAEAKDRADILERVTGTAVYGTLSAAAYARAAKEEAALAELERAQAGAAPLAEGDRAALEARAAEARSALDRAAAAVRAAERAIELERRGTAAATEHDEAERAAGAAEERQQAAEAERAPRAARLGAEKAEAERLRPVLVAARRLDVTLRQATEALGRARREAKEAADGAAAAAAAATALGREERQARADRDAATAWLDAHAPERPLVEGWARWEETLRVHAAEWAAAARADDAVAELTRRREAAERDRGAHAAEDARARAAEAAAREALAAAEQAAASEDSAALRPAREAAAADRERLAALRALVEARDEARAAAERAWTRAAGAGGEAARAAARADNTAAARGAREGARDEARRASEAAHRALSLEAQRALLVEGEPCPLCGATAHPWAAGSPAAELAAGLAARAAELEGEVERLRADEARLRTAAAVAGREAETAGAEAARQDAEAARALARYAAAAAEGDPAPEAQPAELESRLAAAQARVAALRAREREAEQRAAAVTSARLGLDRARSARERAEGALRAAERREAELAATAAESAGAAARARAALAAAEDALAAPLAPWAGWPQRLRSEGAAFGRALAAAVAEHRRRREERDGADERIARLAVRLEAARTTAAERAGVAEARERTAVAAEAERARLAAERAALLDGREADAVETAALSAVQAAEAALESARQAREAAIAARAAALAAAERAGRTAAELREATAGARAALEAAFAEAGLGAVADPDAALSAAQAQESGRREDATELQLQLRQDDERRRQASDLAPRITAQRGHRDVWARVADLIGSADGKKFRVFAQGLTLDALLGHANAHLADLAPRYRLERVPGHDLELQIVDLDMGEEVRSIHSLSGGETFLVSLALALGLSALSSRTTRVETLFIDEGFGTLDRDTLDHAMAALEGLQATGRTVGIITHVPELQERVGVQVRVEPVGGGRSRIRIVDAAGATAA